MMGQAKMGELKCAAQQLGVTSTTLRQHGWKTASPARVKAVRDNPPGWLLVARERCHEKRAQQRECRDHKNTAARLGVRVRVVTDRDIKPGEVEGLLAARPGWLIVEQERRQAQIERKAKDQLHRELTDALVTSVHEVWFQELKYAISDADVDAIDARWAPEVERAKQEARQMAGELAAERVRARIDRERDASREAGRYRASQLARRAFGDDGG
jgi:hypothetical protein